MENFTEIDQRIEKFLVSCLFEYVEEQEGGLELLEKRRQECASLLLTEEGVAQKVAYESELHFLNEVLPLYRFFKTELPLHRKKEQEFLSLSYGLNSEQIQKIVEDAESVSTLVIEKLQKIVELSRGMWT